MIVLHLVVDVRDAMGANTVNTMAEAVAPLVEEITGGTVRLRILSNLADLRPVVVQELKELKLYDLFEQNAQATQDTRTAAPGRAPR